MCFMKIAGSTMVIGSLLYSSVLTATILDGGEVRFRGLVTDEGPRWTWQIATSDQVWAVDTANAPMVSGNLIFDLSNKGFLPFLEGHLYQVSDRGGPGFSPQVTFSSRGQPLRMLEGGNTRQGRFRAAVPVTDPASAKIVGQLAFTVNQGLAAAFGNQEQTTATLGITPGMVLLTGGAVMHLPSDGLSKTVMSRLSSLLVMTPRWKEDMNAVSNGQTLPQHVLASDNISRIAAAYASELSGFELTLPQVDTPSQWQARINVTVTVQ
ncbi:fimbrial protein [Salmonella enterica]|nr:fimbrial protein [Salmonella enterica]